MKSARMLMLVAVVTALMSGGCLQPTVSVVTPAGMNHQNAAATQPAVQADAPPATDAGGEAGNDPHVTALTQQIETLAQRRAADNTAPTTAPAAAETTPVRNAPVADNVAPQAKPIVPAAPIANAPVEPKSAVAAAPAPAPAAARVETAASPSPPPTPVIQAATAPAAPVASPNVSVEIVDVRPALNSIAPANAATDAGTATDISAQGGKATRGSELNSVITQLEKAAEQQPPNPEDQLRLRLLYLAAGMNEKASAAAKGMDPVQSEMLNAIVKTVASAHDAMSKPMEPNPAALAAADDLRRLLGQQSGVGIPRVALVTKVTSFGDYESINPLRFKAGNEIHAYVYTEVANFRSEPVDGDRLRTLLGERVQVFDAAGKVVWERSENNIEDRVRTPRRDFFIPFPLHLPANLPPGDYVLKVSIEDRIGGTTDQQRLSFSIQ